MVAEDTAGSGDRSDEEKEMDQKASEDAERQEDGDVAMATTAAESPSGEDEARDPRKWKWSVIFLCFYGFMSSIKPGEPFITPYLLSPEKNFTREQVSDAHFSA